MTKLTAAQTKAMEYIGKYWNDIPDHPIVADTGVGFSRRTLLALEEKGLLTYHYGKGYFLLTDAGKQWLADNTPAPSAIVEMPATRLFADMAIDHDALIETEDTPIIAPEPKFAPADTVRIHHNCVTPETNATDIYIVERVEMRSELREHVYWLHGVSAVWFAYELVAVTVPTELQATFQRGARRASEALVANDGIDELIADFERRAFTNADSAGVDPYLEAPEMPARDIQ